MIYSDLMRHVAKITNGDLIVPHFEGEDALRMDQLFEYRKVQLKMMGFTGFHLNEIIELFYGENHTRHWALKEKGQYFYNHFTNRIEKNNFHPTNEYFCREEKKGLMNWLPFQSAIKWECRFCNLEGYNRKLSDTLILKILRLKAMKIFNFFNIFEPNGESPFLIGSLWELPPIAISRDEVIYERIGSTVHYILSEWI